MGLGGCDSGCLRALRDGFSALQRIAAVLCSILCVSCRAADVLCGGVPDSWCANQHHSCTTDQRIGLRPVLPNHLAARVCPLSGGLRNYRALVRIAPFLVPGYQLEQHMECAAYLCSPDTLHSPHRHAARSDTVTGASCSDRDRAGAAVRHVVTIRSSSDFWKSLAGGGVPSVCGDCHIWHWACDLQPAFVKWKSACMECSVGPADICMQGRYASACTPFASLPCHVPGVRILSGSVASPCQGWYTTSPAPSTQPGPFLLWCLPLLLLGGPAHHDGCGDECDWQFTWRGPRIGCFAAFGCRHPLSFGVHALQAFSNS
mmetsp:Transcript_6961/g.17837  ORF Transcript_6961/g.17837 Transcript_6961/m.17837 type:complete len:317 (-) Transcript_6961:1518-2468(-)